MDTPLHTPVPAALKVTLYGDLIVLTAGQALDQALIWQARMGQAGLGERLLALAAGPADAGLAPEPSEIGGAIAGLPPDLAFGCALTRRVLRALAVAAPAPPGTVSPEPEALTSLLAAAPPLEGHNFLGERSLAAAWRAVARAVEVELERSGLELAELLRRHGVDPELGRICLHLVERPEETLRPFAFLATLARSRGAHGQIQHLPLAAALAELADDPHRRHRLLAPLHRAADRNAHLRALLDSHELFHPVAWTADEAHAFLRAAPELEAAGVQLQAPSWWRGAPARLQLRVQIGSSEPGLGLAALLDFKLRYFIGDEELTPEEWQRLLHGAAGLHRLGSRWVELDPATQAEVREHWRSVESAAGAGTVGFAEGMRLLAGLPRASLAAEAPVAWTVARPGPWLARTLADLQNPSGSAEADPGSALRGVLRPYQRDGVAWLWLLTRLGLGGCLADDMGLGKTIQVIALLLLLRRHAIAGPNLIVLPASLIGNWRAELERFAPQLRVHVAHRSAGEADTAPPLADIDVVLTTYGTLLRQPWLQAQRWGLVALDEAQAIKNPQAKQTRAVKQLHSRHRLVLTGTPVENSLQDLWSLFDFSSPGLLGASAEFKKFCKRLGPARSAMEPLRALVRPYILRRLKTDRRVIADLPDKTELQVYCGLTRVQAALYAKAVESLAREVAATGGIRRRGIILAYLTRFKQICNHPSQLSRDGRWRAADSAKFLRLQELCAPIAEAGEKLLVFTQFREICEPLAALLAEIFGRPGLVLHGGTAVGKRTEMVAEFQREDVGGAPFMVLSLKAGGTGLNLTAAAHVVHFDRWWNPAVENQATDRAYRIGQHKNVLVHKFVCRGTLEERIDAMLHRKQGLAEGLLGDEGELRLTELTTDELMRVVALDLRSALSEDD
jgi:non-specific serine/threonine protein kinase